MKVKVKKLSTQAKLPIYSTDGSGCFDLFSNSPSTQHLHSGCSVSIGTGLQFEIPEGHVMLVFSRSGHGFVNDIRLANCVGVIDSDYRGQVMVKLTNDKEVEVQTVVQIFHPGAKIAQAMIIPIPKIEFEEVEELSETVRGEGGFGSTGE